MAGKGWMRRVLFGLVTAYVTLPILAALLYSLSTSWTGNDGRVLPDGYTLHWWTGLISDDRLVAAVGRSLMVALLTVAIVTAMIVPPLYWAYVRNPRLRTLMSTVALIPFALPFVVMAFGIKEVTSHIPVVSEYSSSWQMVVVGHVALCFPFFLWPVDAAMAAAGIPRLHEAAQTSGANAFTTLVRVVIPNIRTGLLTGSILVFAISFGEYSIAKVITGASFETVPVWQVQLTPVNGGGNPNGVAVMSVITFALFFAVSLFAALTKGGTSVQALPGVGSTKGSR